MKTPTKLFIPKRPQGLVLLFFLLLMVWSGKNCCAQKEVPFTLDDRERLIRLETKVEEFGNRLIRLETKTEGLEMQIADIKKQISELKGDTNDRFNELQADLRWMIGIFISSIFILVGFILWDRRTFLKPFESRAIELESEVKNIKSILSAFRELAKMDNKVAQVLRQYNLL